MLAISTFTHSLFTHSLYCQHSQDPVFDGVKQVQRNTASDPQTTENDRTRRQIIE